MSDNALAGKIIPTCFNLLAAGLSDFEMEFRVSIHLKQ